MRPRDILRYLKERYITKHLGPNRAKRREVESQARQTGRAKFRKKNWTRDRHKRRKEEKRRRKQKYGL